MTSSTPQPEADGCYPGCKGTVHHHHPPQPEATDERRQRAERELDGTNAWFATPETVRALASDLLAVLDERASLEAERDVLRGIVARLLDGWTNMEDGSDPTWEFFSAEQEIIDTATMSPDEVRVLSELGDQT